MFSLTTVGANQMEKMESTEEEEEIVNAEVSEIPLGTIFCAVTRWR